MYKKILFLGTRVIKIPELITITIAASVSFFKRSVSSEIVNYPGQIAHSPIRKAPEIDVLRQAGTIFTPPEHGRQMGRQPPRPHTWHEMKMDGRDLCWHSRRDGLSL